MLDRKPLVGKSVYLACSLGDYIHHGGKGMVTGGRGHWSHDVRSQEVERGECYAELACFFLLCPGDAATWYTRGESFPPQLHFSGNTLTGTP